MPKNEFFLYLLESSLSLATFYGLYRLLLHRETCFAFNRAFILGAIGFSVLLPLVEIPASERYLPAIQLPLENLIVASSATVQAETLDGWDTAFSLYLSGVVLSACLLLYRLFALWRLAQQFPAEQHEGFVLVRTAGPIPTFSFFRWLFWNDQANLTEAQQQQIWQHELTHIRQRHSVDVLLVEIAKIAFWFNPCIYLLQNSLRTIHEYLADREATRHGNHTSYTQLMAAQLLQKFNLSLTQPFNPSQLQNRITMLRLSRTTRPAVWKIAVSLLTVTLLSLVYACRSIEPLEPRGENLSQVPFIEKIPQVRPILSKTFARETGRTMRYPASARADGITGIVYASFLVDHTGSVSDITIDRGLRQDLDDEVLRTLTASALKAKFEPAKLDGQTVKARVNFPVTFLLDNVNTDKTSSQPGRPSSSEGMVVVGYGTKPK